MQFNKKGKNNVNSSRLEDLNSNNSVLSGTLDTGRVGRETTGRPTQLNLRDKEKSTTDSGYREVLYLDNNDRRLQNMSPGALGRQINSTTFMASRSPTNSRSPTAVASGHRNSILSSVRNDLNVRPDTAQMMGNNPIPTINVQLPFRNENDLRTKMDIRDTIKLAGDEVPLKSRMSPRESTAMGRQKFEITKEEIPLSKSVYNNKEDNDNILLDKPVNVLGTISGGEVTNNSKYGRDPRERDREIQFPRDFTYSGDNINLKNKMSPNRNVSEREIMYDKNHEEDNRERINNLKRLSKLMHQIGNEYEENDKIVKLNLEKAEEADNIYKNYGKDIDKIMRQRTSNVDYVNFKRPRTVTKVYNKEKKEGTLINKQAAILKPTDSNNDFIFPDRRTVMQRMNKLSHILMSKSRSNDSFGNTSSYDDDMGVNQSHARQTLRPNDSRSDIRKTHQAGRTANQSKFIKLSLAMLSSKGPNCEDRIITRVMRYEKGGVVDLHQSRQKTKKYEVKKVRRAGDKSSTNAPNKRYGPKDRERASKIVQAWWREILNKYKNMMDKVVLIQSVWKGHFLRTYLYDILTSTIMMQTFVDKVKKPIVEDSRRTVLDVLYPYALKFHARKNLTSIIKIQSQARGFLFRTRFRMYNLQKAKQPDKNKLKSGRQISEKEEDVEPQIEKTKSKPKSTDLFEKVKKAMRVRIFHYLMQNAFNKPVEVLKTHIFRRMLKKNLIKFGNMPLRLWFKKWMKEALKNTQDTQNNNQFPIEKAVAPLLKAMRKPALKSVVQGLKNYNKHLDQDLFKIKLLRRLMKNAEKYKDIFLRFAFRKWADKSRLSIIENFKNIIGAKFLHKFTKKLLDRNLGSKLRLWRYKKDQMSRVPTGKDTGSTASNHDIKQYAIGIRNLKKHISLKLYDMLMPIKSVEGAKSRAIKGLFRNSNTFKKTALRHYLKKWKKFVSYSRKIELSSKIIRGFGNKIFKKRIHHILLDRFLNWRRKSNLITYQSNSNKHFLGTEEIFDWTKKYAKKKALIDMIPNLKSYLSGLLKDQAVKSILALQPKLGKLHLRQYWNKLRAKIIKLREHEMRSKFFNSMLGKTNSTLTKRHLKKYFDKWFKSRPKESTLKKLQGMETLLNGLRRKHLPTILKHFNQKIDLVNAKDGIKMAFNVKNRYIKNHWREYLLKWRKNMQLLKTKQLIHDLSGKLINRCLTEFGKRSLASRFFKWARVKPVNLQDQIQKYSDFTNLLTNGINKKTVPLKRGFLKKAKGHVGSTMTEKAIHIMMNLAINGRRIKLYDGFNKWRLRTKDREIHDYKLMLLRYSIGQQGVKNKKSSLSSIFYRWLRNAKKSTYDLHSDNKLHLYKGFNFLNPLFRRRYNDFFIRLNRLMNLDHRGELIWRSFKRIMAPRNTIGRLFDRWRRNNLLHKNDVESKNLLSRFMNRVSGNTRKRMLRDAFITYFLRWRRLSRKPENYYIRIVDGTNRADHFMKSKLKSPFNQIANHKNYKKIFTDCLPISSRLRKRAEKDSVLRLWNVWKKNVLHGRQEKFRNGILRKVIKSRNLNNKLNKFNYAFYKWKNTPRNSLSFPNIVKGSDKIMNTLQKRYRRPIFDKLDQNCKAKVKSLGLTTFFSKSKTFANHKLRNYLLRWWKINVYNLDAVKSRVMRNVKKFVIENHMMGPLEKYFRRWLRNMIEKPKDYPRLINASSTLLRGMRKNKSKDFLNNLNKFRNPNRLRNAILDLLPNRQKLMKRHLSRAFSHYKQQVDALKLKDMYGKLLSTVYGKNKEVLRKRFLKNALNKLARKPKEKKPVDLAKLLKGEKIIFRVIAKKYMAGFNDGMKVYLNNKFLRSCLNKNSKFHKKALLPFFNRWRDTANKLKSKQANSELSGKLLSKTRAGYFKKAIKNILKSKFDQWKNVIKQQDKFNKDIVPKVIDLVRRGVYRKLFPTFTKTAKKLKSGFAPKKALKNVKAIINKIAKNGLDYRWKHWRDYVNQARMDDLRNKMMSSHLKNFTKRMMSNNLRRCYLIWANKHRYINVTPAKFGVATLRKLFLRPSFDKIHKKAKNTLSKIPEDSDLQNAMKKFNPALLKSLKAKNLFMRPFWKKWRQKTKRMKNDQLKSELFKRTMLPNLKNKGKTMLRRYLNLWKDKVNQEKALESEKTFRTKIIKGIYNKNGRIWLKHKFNHWRMVIEKQDRDLEHISLGVIKLRHKFARNGFNTIRSKVYSKNNITPFQMVKKMMLMHLRNNDLGNLAWGFSLWRKNLNKDREHRLKHKIITTMLRNRCNQEDNNNENVLHEKFLRWRINAAPKNYFDNINRIRIGVHTAQKGLTMRHNRPLFDGIKEKSRFNHSKQLVYSFAAKYDKKADFYILKNRFAFWKVRVGDTEILTKRLARLMNQYVKSDPVHEELFKKPATDLVTCMKSWVAFKTNKAKSIQDYCKNLLLIFQRMKFVQRNRNLHKLFSGLNMKYAVKVRLLFARWMKNANLINSEESAKKIQHFLRGGIDARTRNRKRIGDGMEKVEKYVKLKSMKKINDRSKDNRLKQLMIRLLPDIPPELKKQFLSKCWNKWRKVIADGKEHAAAELIGAALRGFLTRQFMRLLYKRNSKINSLTLKLFGKYLDKKKLYFNKWLLDTRLEQCRQSAGIISAFLKPRFMNLKLARANMRLYEIFRKKYINTVVDGLKKTANVNSNRGFIMYDTLKNIFIQQPFDHIKEASKWIGRLAKLHSVTPRIHFGLRKYWLPFYMRRWKQNTYDDKIRRIIQLQNWYRSRVMIWRAKAAARRMHLTQKYLSKLTNDNSLKLKLALKLWSKIGKLAELNRQATAVQAMWKGNVSRRGLNKDLNQVKLNKLFRKGFIKKVSDNLTTCSDFVERVKSGVKSLDSEMDRRYPTNNLLSVANDKLRSRLINKLTQNAADKDTDRLLRKGFDRFKLWSKHSTAHVVKLQSKYRQSMAKKKLNKILHTKDKLLKLYGKFDNSQGGKLRIAFNKWNNRANILKLNESAKIIQDFTKKNYSQLMNWRFKKFFYNNAEKLVKRRLLNAVKLNKLKESIQKPYLKALLCKMQNNKKWNKIGFFIGRRFGDLDNQMRALYLRKYLLDWLNNAKKIRNQLNACALAITALFKGHIVRRFVAKLLEKKNRMRLMMLRLANDKEYLLGVALKLWSGKVKSSKLDDSARVLQKYLRNVKDKSSKLKSSLRNEKFKNGNDVLNAIVVNKIKGRRAIKKIKEEAGRKLLGKVCDDLENKRRDHLSHAYKSINDLAMRRYMLQNDAAKKIQNKFNIFKQKRGIWGLVYKMRKLRFLLHLMSDRKGRQLNKAFRIWRKNALGEQWHQAARTIQNFINNKVLKWKNQQTLNSKDKLRSKLRKHILSKKLKPFAKDFNNTIKINEFNKLMGKYIFSKFKYNAENFKKYQYINRLFRIPKRLGKKYLSIALRLWRTNATKLKEDEAARMIQQKFKSGRDRDLNRKKFNVINNMLKELAIKHSNTRQYYLRLWKRKAQEIRIRDSGDVITKFVGKHWNRQKAAKLWWRLTNGLYIKNGIYSGLNLLRRFKQARGIEALFKFCDNKIKRGSFKDLLENGKNRRSLRLIKTIFGDFQNRKNNLSLNHYFTLWLKKKAKLSERDRAVSKLSNIFDYRRKVIGAKTIGDAALVKTIFNIVNAVRAKDAIKNIKWNINESAAYKHKLKNFGNLLIKGNSDLKDKNIDLFANKLYRLYIYKLLDKLHTTTQNFILKSTKPLAARALLKGIKDRSLEGSLENFKNKKEVKVKATPLHKKYKASVRNPRNVEAEKSENKYKIPCIKDLLNKMKTRRMQWALDNLRNKRSTNKLYDALDKAQKTLTREPRNLFLLRLKQLANYNKQTPILQANLYKLFRRYFIRNITNELGPINKMHKLHYLVRVIFMNRDVSSKRFLTELVRRWRFIVYMKKLAKQKLEVMYKNMHLNYLNMAKEVFGDGNNENGMIQEFENFGNSIGMFTNVDIAEYESGKKNFYKHVTKRYKFQAKEFEESHYEENSVLGKDLNPEYYYDEGIGEATQGRYKIESNISDNDFAIDNKKKTNK